jgi:hypothetical protein
MGQQGARVTQAGSSNGYIPASSSAPPAAQGRGVLVVKGSADCLGVGSQPALLINTTSSMDERKCMSYPKLPQGRGAPTLSALPGRHGAASGRPGAAPAAATPPARFELPADHTTAGRPIGGAAVAAEEGVGDPQAGSSAKRARAPSRPWTTQEEVGCHVHEGDFKLDAEAGCRTKRRQGQ